MQRLVGHIALRCPKEKGAKLEERLRDSHSRKRFAVQKGRSDAGPVDNDHAEAKTGFLLSGFICGQRCKWWSHRPKLTSSVISDVKLIIYIFLHFKCTTGNSIGAQKYKNTGKVNGQKAMLLRGTGADETFVHGS